MSSASKAGRVGSVFFLVTFFVVMTAAAQRSSVPECGPLLGDQREAYVPLPNGDVFCPLVADPKQPHSFVSYVRSTAGAFETDIGAVGIGEHFGLFRWGALQLSVGAGIFAQFDLLTPSYDLINADYLIGLPLTFRYRHFSTRFRIYHQSSHLGDELLLRTPPTPVERENLSFEAVEFILSQEIGMLRLYGGGEVLFNREPNDLEPTLIHGGLEIRPSGDILQLGDLGGIRFLAAGDAKTPAEQEWTPAISVRAGLEFSGSREISSSSRSWRLMAEYYDGPSPYGQFFEEHVTYYGVGIHLSL